MRMLVACALLVILGVPVGPSASAFADEKPTGPNSGTAPENRGVTGWSGGTRDQKTDEDSSAEAQAAAGQPWMAEGLDLKGDPRRFSPKTTVE